MFRDTLTVFGSKPQVNLCLSLEELLGIRPFEDLEHNRLALVSRSADESHVLLLVVTYL